jgi:2-polyprenyl-6-methoxyphenol hydroxylase-like FAD-dependent oxidoreductase
MARRRTTTDAGSGVNVNGSPAEIFDQLSRVDRPETTEVLFDTACVLGGSIAGLLAARVLADHARKVLVVERDEVNVDGLPREGVPHDRQGHALLPGGLAQIERWLPGYTQEALDLGAVMADPFHSTMYLDGRPQVRGDVDVLGASRPFFESRMRARVLALPNISTVRARASGLRYRDDAVGGVLCTTEAGEDVVAADFVVDAMGRSSRLSDWLEQDGYHRPALQRVPTGISYATAYFARLQTPEELELVNAIAQYAPGSGPDEIAAAGVNAIENDQWQLMMMTYARNEAGRSADAFRATCAKLPPLFREASSNEITREVLTYHHADNRRRDFVGPNRLPARLVSTGDAVASFNPVYGQGISSAALHASCLSRYLTTGPDLQVAATSFFELQQVVVDAAWAMSAGADAARRDALDGVEVPADVAHQRWVMAQLIEATLVDETVTTALNRVAAMLVHPDSLADPELLDRALAAKRRLAADGGPS